MFGLKLDEWTQYFRETYGKGGVLARALYRQYYKTGTIDPAVLPEFSRSGPLVDRIAADFSGPLLPDIRLASEEGGTLKFLTRLHDGPAIESVILPMGTYNTLCVSSQVGCQRDCRFCRTARMGLIRNLTAAEMVGQVQSARFGFGRPVENVVFMGMGEPLDNLDEVLRAVEILGEPKGNPVHRKNISLSTCGVASGIRRLTELDRLYPEKGYRSLVLSLSLNSVNPETRRRLMPVTKEYPLEELKRALEESPQARYRNKLFYEYILIPGVNDSEQDARQLTDWLGDLPGKVNLIPWNPVEGLAFRRPSEGELRRFWRLVLEGGRGCLVRVSRGDAIRAACGQLGGATSGSTEASSP
jgi:23S rRNA (adenine2503-C2)-methyltransferase